MSWAAGWTPKKIPVQESAPAQSNSNVPRVDRSNSRRQGGGWEAFILSRLTAKGFRWSLQQLFVAWLGGAEEVPSRMYLWVIIGNWFCVVRLRMRINALSLPCSAPMTLRIFRSARTKMILSLSLWKILYPLSASLYAVRDFRHVV